MDDDGWILNRSVCGKSIRNSTICPYKPKKYSANIGMYYSFRTRTYEIPTAFKHKLLAMMAHICECRFLKDEAEKNIVYTVYYAKSTYTAKAITYFNINFY